MDSSCWLAVELNLNPFFLWPVLGKNCKRHIRLANERSLQRVFVSNLDMHIVCEHISFNLHELECPRGIFASVVASFRAPFLLANANSYERVHLVEGTAKIVLKMG